MKKLLPVLLLGLAALATAGVLYFGDYPLPLPLLPARQSTFTLLYTGDVSGYVVPCPH